MKNNLPLTLNLPKILCLYFLFMLLLFPDVFGQTCEIAGEHLMLPCNNAGTGSDPTDDYFEVAFAMDSPNGGTTYTVTTSPSVVPPATGTYGPALGIDGIPADGAIYTMTVTDDLDSNCIYQIEVSRPPCSFECEIIINDYYNINCNSNGTPNDPTDDLLDVVLDVNALNGGITGEYIVLVNGLFGLGSYEYGYPASLGSLPWDCSTFFLEVIDVDDPNCLATIWVETCDCTNSCDINIFSNAIASCPGNSNNSETACEKICAYSQVEYTTDAIGDVVDVNWTVQGAESYTVQGDDLLVNWGAPGSGQVSLTTETFDIVEIPFSFHCTGGTPLDSDTNAGGDVYFQIFGGQPPYNIIASSGQVYYFGTPGADDDGGYIVCTYAVEEWSSSQDCMQLPAIDNVIYDCDPINGISISYEVLNPDYPVLAMWTGSNGFTSYDDFLVNVPPGDYELTIINVDDCSTTRSFFNECNYEPVCTEEKVICIDILENAVADFNTVPPIINGSVEVCAGQEIYFENISENAEYFNWDFGTPEAFTSNNVSFIYDNPGNYVVNLIARNECLCTDTTSIVITVGDAPRPDINCTGTICEGDAVEYTSSANCGNYNWTIINGTITEGGGSSDNFVIVDWGSGPVGTIELTVADCDMNFCPDPAIFQVPVISNASSISGPDKVCKGDVVSYTIPDFGGVSFSWSVSSDGEIQSGQGTNTVLVYWSKDASPGMEWVSVSYESCYLECGGEETYDVLIADEFYANGDINACVNTETSFVGRKASNGNPVACNWFVNNPDGSLLWSSSNGTDSFEITWPDVPGIYEIEASIADPSGFCVEKYNLFMTLEDKPDPPLDIIGDSVICTGIYYTYTAQSDLPNSSFVWAVTSGLNTQMMQGATISVNWGNSPPYTLGLTQVSGDGLPCESDPITKSMTHLSDFSISGVSENCIYTTETYTADFYENVNYEWSIAPADAGTIISGENSAVVEVYWTKSGSASVELELCNIEKVFPVMIADLPEPVVILPDGLCPGETASVSTTEIFSSYLWKDENGTTISTTANADLGGGFFELIVTNATGCENTTAFEIPIFLSPEVNISTESLPFYCPDNESPPLIVGLDTEDGYTYEWFFNNAPTGNTSASIVGLDFGTYYLQVVDVNNCVINSNPIVISEDCVGVSDPQPGCIVSGGFLDFDASLETFCTDYAFQNLSVNYVPGSLFWQFDYAGNIFSYEENPSYTYPSAGFFHPILWGNLPSSNVPGGCPLGVTRDVRIPAAANFDFTTACAGETVFFTDKTVFMPGTSIVGWFWNFGDTPGPDNTSTLQNPEHIYENPGVYNIELAVTHEDGCISSYNKNYTVFPIPEVNFMVPETNCELVPIQFMATSNTQLVNYHWNFGDPASGAADTANVQDTYHAFSAAGVYTIMLTATDIYGCEASHTEMITVSENTLSGSITREPSTPICEGDWVNLIAPEGGVAWQWTTGDTEANLPVSEAGLYGLTVTDAQGCTHAPWDVPVQILPAPVGSIRLVEYDAYGQAVNYVYDNYTACYGEDIFLEVTNATEYSYAWPEGSTSTEISFTDERGNLLEPGSHTFTVTITDNESGCTTITDPFEVNISNLPDKPILASNPVGPICNGSSAILSVQNANANYNYLWSNGALGESISTNVPGEYTVIAVTPNGCRRESDPIEIFKGPETVKIPGGCHTRCNPDTICIPEIPDIVSWQWYFNDSPVPAPEGNQPDFVMELSGDYHAVLTDENGCSATSETLTVELYEALGVVAGQVWFDVNDNGFIDPNDTLMQNVSILLNSGAGFEEMQASDAYGNYDFSNIPSTNYTLELLQNSLPAYVEAYTPIQSVVLEGCDDEEEILWLCHQVCPVLESTEAFVVCPGEEALYGGNLYPVGTSETISLLSVEGCDSLILLTVDSFQVAGEQIFETACAGEFFMYENNEILAGESLALSYIDSNGCNALRTIMVEELFVYDTTMLVKACEGEAYDYNGTFIPTGTSESFTLQSIAGCDSLVTISVEALDIYNLTEFAAVCEGEFYDYNGNMIAAGTEQIFTYLSVDGCDSIVTIIVEALENTESFLEFTICDGDSYTFMGTTIPAGESAEFVLTNAQNCDSLLTVQVNIATAPLSVNPVSVCPDEFYFYEGNDYPIGTDTTIVLTDQEGCDSMVQLIVSAYPPFAFDLETEATCWQYDDGSIFIENISGGLAPFTYSLDGTNYVAENAFMNLAPGEYTVFVQDDNCIFQQAISVPAVPRLVASWEEAVIGCEEENTRVTVALTGGAETTPTFLWPDGGQGTSNIVAAPGIYPVTISNVCETLVEEIVVKPATDGREEFIYVPNVFSPNNDGVNDLFLCAPADDVELLSFEMHLYNRWGAVLFETYDVTVGWDGSFKEEDLQPGVYVYWMKADFVVCYERKSIFKKGDVVIVK